MGSSRRVDKRRNKEKNEIREKTGGKKRKEGTKTRTKGEKNKDQSKGGGGCSSHFDSPSVELAARKERETLKILVAVSLGIVALTFIVVVIGFAYLSRK